MKSIVLVFVLFFVANTIFAQSNSSIKFTFLKQETWKPVTDSVHLVLNDTIVVDLLPDKDGVYILKQVAPANYTIRITSKAYAHEIEKKIQISPGKTSYISVGVAEYEKKKKTKKARSGSVGATW